MGHAYSKLQKRKIKMESDDDWEIVESVDHPKYICSQNMFQNRTTHSLMVPNGRDVRKINENYQNSYDITKVLSSENLYTDQFISDLTNSLSTENQLSSSSPSLHNSSQQNLPMVNILHPYASLNSILNKTFINDDRQACEINNQNSGYFTNSTSFDNSQITTENLHIGPKITCTLSMDPNCHNPKNELEDFIRRKSCILQQKYQLGICKYFNICFEDKSQFNDMLFSKKQPISPHEFGEKLKWDTKAGRGVKVLISGSPMFGKSTFCSHLAYYWATRQSDVLNNFQLVFFIEGKKYQSLRNNLLNQISEMDDDVATSDSKNYKFLKRIQDKILIIIDDFDNIKNCEEVKKIINCELFPESTIIITSRPNKAKDISSLFIKHLHIEGFCSNQICTYAESVFTESTFLELSKIVGDIRKIYHLFSCPWLANSFCSVAEYEKEFQINPTLISFLTRVFIKATHELDIDLVNLGNLCYDKIVYRFSGNACKFSVKDNKLLGDFEWFLSNTDNSKSYLYNFLIAKYLIRSIEKENFRDLLWTYLGKQCNSDVLNFLLCLAEETEVKIILENLPWSFTQDLLSFLKLMNKNFNKDYISSVIRYFPKWTNFTINEGCRIIERSIRNINIVSDYSLMLGTNDSLHPDSVLQLRFLDIIQLPNYQLSYFYFEINQIDDDAFVYALKILQSLEKNLSLLCLIIDVHKTTEKVIELLNRLKHPSLKSLIFLAEDGNVNSGEVFKEMDCSTLNERLPQLSLLQFKSKHVSHRIVKQLLKCDHLDSLIIQPFSAHNISTLSTLIIEKKISHLSLQLNLNKEDIELIKPLPLKQQSSMLSPLCTAINNSESMLTYLDMRNSEMTYPDINCLLKHVINSKCTSLLLGGCINKIRNGPLEVDLFSITPPQKIWTYLDFSNWRLISSQKEIGQIKKLKIYDIETQVNMLQLAQIFHIQSLCCNYCKNLEQNTPCAEVRELKLNIPDEEKLISLSKVFKNFPNMNVLKFKCKSTFYTQLKEDHDLWKSNALLCHSIRFSIRFCPEKTVEHILQMMMRIIIEKRNIQKFSLNMLTSCGKIWEKYMDEILMFLEGVFSKRCLQEVTVIQRSDSYSCFVQHLDSWQMKNCKTFTLSSSINSKNKIAVIISHHHKDTNCL